MKYNTIITNAIYEFQVSESGKSYRILREFDSKTGKKKKEVGRFRNRINAEYRFCELVSRYLHYNATV